MSSNLDDPIYRARIRTCARCEFGNKFGRCNGVCSCLADKTGASISDHAKAGECPLHRFGLPPVKKRVVVQLSRFGDILNILPAVRQMAIEAGEAIPVVVAEQYASLLAGLSYVKPVIYAGPESDPMGAAEMARKIAETVIVTQNWGNPAEKPKAMEGGPQSYNEASWHWAGMLHLWDRLPLVLDNRDEDRETQLLQKVIGDYQGPVVLAVVNGRSSPYPPTAAKELIAFLTDTTAAKIVDISEVKAECFQDFCGLFERASALVSTDTAPLHLSTFNRLPTVAVVNDTPWRASCSHKHWVERLTYAESRTPEGKGRISVALAAVLGHPAPVPNIVHVTDSFTGKNHDERRRHWLAENSWQIFESTYRFNRYPRSSADLGDGRGLPYVRDVFDAAVSRADNNDLIVFTNSDVAVVPEAPEVIRRAMLGRDCCFSFRVSFPSLEVPRNRKELREAKYLESDGRDLFAFRPSWWLKHRDEFPDLLLGCEGWDTVLAYLMGRDAEIPPVVYHQNHETFWSADVNRDKNPGQLHNRKLCREWALRTGRQDQLRGDDYVFVGSKLPGYRFSYAQQHWDLKIADCFPHDYVGTCIEVGAVDGRHISNTLLLEEAGWNCLCIEANPNHLQALKLNRKHPLSVAVGAENRENVEFTIVSTNSEVMESSISALTIDNDLLESHRKNGHPCRQTVVTVPVKTLDWCVDQFAPQKIDCVSIDVEGGELDVLRGFDLRRWEPAVMVIESNDPGQRERIREYMGQYGYRLHLHDWPNDLFVSAKWVDPMAQPVKPSQKTGKKECGKCRRQRNPVPVPLSGT